MERIDLRSDTVTLPSPGMRQAMAAAPVGDDQYGEDPTVNRLQERIAELLGKEAALFVPSGTMANQIGLKILTRPGDDVVVGDEAHIVWHESGAAAANSGVQFTVVGRGGLFTAADLRAAYKPPGHIVFPPTTLVAVENTHNRGGGVVFPQSEVVAICDTARELGLASYLDGARLFNTAAATGRSLAELAAPFDFVSVALSKGLGCPVGSLIAGRYDEIVAGPAGAAHVRRRDAPIRHSRRRRPLRARPQSRSPRRGSRQCEASGGTAGGIARGPPRSCDGAEQHRDLSDGGRRAGRRRPSSLARRRRGCWYRLLASASCAPSPISM